MGVAASLAGLVTTVARVFSKIVFRLNIYAAIDFMVVKLCMTRALKSMQINDPFSRFLKWSVLIIHASSSPLPVPHFSFVFCVTVFSSP